MTGSGEPTLPALLRSETLRTDPEETSGSLRVLGPLCGESPVGRSRPVGLRWGPGREHGCVP